MNNVTKKNLKKFGCQDFIAMVFSAWLRLTQDCVKNSFAHAQLLSQDQPRAAPPAAVAKNSCLEISFLNQNSLTCSSSLEGDNEIEKLLFA